MAIKGNRNVGGTQTEGPSSFLSKEEAAFIASKLQQATYQGAEFEMYYKIMQKLQELVSKK